MKKTLIFALTVCFATTLASSVLALRWLDNMSYRVETMGGATLAIEDETTALTAYNHENCAGLAFEKKMNRLDGGLMYSSTNYSQDITGGTYKVTSSDMALTRPGAEYRGVTYWLGDDLVIKAGIEGMLINATMTTEVGGTSTEEKIDFSGLGGGAGLVYKTDFGLALGAGLKYIGAGGKPDPLDGSFDVYRMIALMFGTTGTTDKIEMTATNLGWSVGAAYVLDEIGEDNKLALGFQVGADDTLPNVASFSSLASIGSTSFGDYNAVVEMGGNIVGIGDVTNTTTYTATPLKISGEAIFDLGSTLQAGLLFDSKTLAVQEKTESSGYGVFAADPTDYKAICQSQLGISPVVTAKLALGEDLNLLPGVMFTTWGSGALDAYSLDYSTADVNDTYKSSTTEISSGVFAIGLGLQAMSKQLQAGVQYESGSNKSENTPYAVDGTAGTVSEIEGSSSTIRLGAEFWVMPILAIRAGYAMLSDVTKDGTFDSDGNVVDDINNTSRITFGLGVAMPDGLKADLLVKLDTYTDDPALDPKPTNTAMGIFLGVSTPL
ncbi:hypothetical protein KAR34_03580 [bacterium]|nr:hypothetical protein [bacterium]